LRTLRVSNHDVNPKPNRKYLTLALLRDAGYETPGYEKVKSIKRLARQYSLYAISIEACDVHSE